MTHRGPFQPLLFCDSVIKFAATGYYNHYLELYKVELPLQLLSLRVSLHFRKVLPAVPEPFSIDKSGLGSCPQLRFLFSAGEGSRDISEIIQRSLSETFQIQNMPLQEVTPTLAAYHCCCAAGFYPPNLCFLTSFSRETVATRKGVMWRKAP